jgi:hypothetical protein
MAAASSSSAKLAALKAKAAVAMSSSLIVPWPCASAMPAPRGFKRLTKKVSSPSGVSSPLTGTMIVRVVCPAANVSVPETDS